MPEAKTSRPLAATERRCELRDAGPKKGTVILLGTYVMPDQTPAALRALGIAEALRAAGYECIFGAGELAAGETWRPAGYCDVVEGFPVTSLAELGGPTSKRWRRAIGGMLLAGQGASRWLASKDLSGVEAVIANGGYSPMMLRLQRLLRRRRVPLVVDIADWYDPWHVPGGPFTPYCWQIELAMRLLHKRCEGVLTVSSFLRGYYTSPDRPTVRVPPTTDTRKRKWVEALGKAPADAKELRLVYAGTAGRKDDLAMVVEAVTRARDQGARIKLAMIGPSMAEVLRALPEDLRGGVKTGECCFPGRVKHEAVPGLLAESDFSVLMRPRKRYAEAGFPTKLVESFCAGVPAILNETSDVAEYVQDGVEGLIVPAYSVEALAVTLVGAARISLDRRLEMRRAARARAEGSFDNLVYSAVLDELVSALRRANSTGGRA